MSPRIPVFFVHPVDIYYMKILDIVRIRAVEGARTTAWQIVAVEDLTSGQHKTLDFTLPDDAPQTLPPLPTLPCDPDNDPFGLCTEITTPPLSVEAQCDNCGCVRCPAVKPDCLSYASKMCDTDACVILGIICILLL